MSRTLQRMRACVLAGVAAFGFGVPAASEVSTQTGAQRVGIWTISSHARDGAFTHCAMSARSAHRSIVLLFFISRTTFQLAISGVDWNLQTGTEYNAFYRPDEGNPVSARGRVVRPHILNLSLRAERVTFEQFRTASAVRIGVVGAPELTFDFAMPGSAAAFDRLLACAAEGRRIASTAPGASETPRPALPGHNVPAPRPPARTVTVPSPPGAPQPGPGERRAQGELKRTAAATGFYVSAAGHILTAAHVVSQCKSIRAQLIGEPSSPATLIAKSEADDLALLKTAAAPPAVAPLRLASIRLGEPIVQFGFPLTEDLASSGNVTTGVVAALAGARDDHRKIQVSAPTQAGNSGGPVLDMRGRVVGVVVSAFGLRFARSTGTLPQNVNFAVKSSVASSFLEAHGVSIAPAVGPEQDLPVPDVADRARKFTVRIDCLE
jgi:S1-C subfamily serine protease